MRVDTLTAKEVATSGAALTILSELAVREEQKNGRLSAARIGRPAIKRTVALGLHVEAAAVAGRALCRCAGAGSGDYAAGG